MMDPLHMPAFKNQLFFGRRKGRGLRPNPHARAMNRLKDLSIDRWKNQWPKELWLEIGFGSGEHLKNWLIQHPTRSVIGVEVFLNGLVNCMDILPPELEDRCAFFSEPVQQLWPLLPESLLDGITLFFPDPWPKQRHRDRRMVQPAFLDLCARHVKPGGLFHFASDHGPLIDHVLKNLHTHTRWRHIGGAKNTDPHQWPSWPDHWPSSRYRDKALEKNIPCSHSIWQENPADQNP